MTARKPWPTKDEILHAYELFGRKGNFSFWGKPGRLSAIKEVAHAFALRRSQFQPPAVSDEEIIGASCYRGNTVRYIYDKLDNYSRQLGEVSAALRRIQTQAAVSDEEIELSWHQFVMSHFGTNMTSEEIYEAGYRAAIKGMKK